ncbi:MAG: hypothetical protein RLZZ282_912 [Verrucomicrobiota bacterium]
MLEMSRRSRKRRNSNGHGWLGKAALGLVVVGVLAAGILYAMVRGYLYSDAFRKFLSDKASRAAGVHGDFTPFRWDGLALEAAAFEASGAGLITALRVDGLHTEVGVGGLGRGVWEIRESRLERLEVALDASGDGGGGPQWNETLGRRLQGKESGWFPREVELQGLEVREVVLTAKLAHGAAAACGMRVRVVPAGKNRAYRIEVADGTLRLPFGWVPDVRLARAHLRYQDGQVFLHHASADVWNDGHLEVSGEWDSAAKRYTVEGNVAGVKCDQIFNPDWSKRVTGDVSSDFTLEGHAGTTVARGRFKMLNGTLTALPLLDSLAAYADTRRFRVMALSDVRTDWKAQNGEFLFTDVVIASEGLVRLEGNLTIRGRALDGTFRLGLAPGTLASIPGAETGVFAPGARGLVWAPLRITGTLDDPKEDLTDRLVAAAGLRMFDVIPETGEKVMKFTQSWLGKSPSEAVDQGVKIIEDGSKTVRAVSGIFGEILGSPVRPAPAREMPQAPVPP